LQQQQKLEKQQTQAEKEAANVTHPFVFYPPGFKLNDSKYVERMRAQSYKHHSSPGRQDDRSLRPSSDSSSQRYYHSSPRMNPSSSPHSSRSGHFQQLAAASSSSARNVQFESLRATMVSGHCLELYNIRLCLNNLFRNIIC